ncbi:hypothetical protein [Chelativorans sp.]|uniref:hypothetical protein n=1 Tax=Chelativorans sp. TaxID=2203393 RepID=UPI0028123608|nr:hypothetical protein [Chelativorans sp.]
MTLNFPLPLTDFADLLSIETVAWKLERWDEYSGLGNGDVIAAELAPPRWSGDVSIAPMYNDDAASVQALIESLDGAINSFYLYAPQKAFPMADPDGTLLGSATPTIGSLGANNKSLTVSGLPAGYVLTRGDLFSFDYGTNPVRRGFHRVAETVMASAGGVTPSFEVRPHFRPGVTTGRPITLIKPAAKVFIMPGSFNPGTASGPITSGMSFQVMQRP